MSLLAPTPGSPLVGQGGYSGRCRIWLLVYEEDVAMETAVAWRTRAYIRQCMGAFKGSK